MDQIWNQIKFLAETGDGIIRTSQVEQAGISRPMLKKYVDTGKLQRVRKGIYILADGFADVYKRQLLRCDCGRGEEDGAAGS